MNKPGAGNKPALTAIKKGGLPLLGYFFVRIISACLIIAAAHSVFPSPGGAEVPAKITYQGNIRQNGALVTGQRNIVFRLYASSVSASALWTSPVHPVSISTGVFKVDLEPVLGDWETGSLWLELEIEGVRLSPRDELTSSPYSINSLLHSGKRYSTSAAPPLAPALGDLWMDSSANMFRYWNGAAWTGGGTGGGMPDPHVYTHAPGGSDPLTALGAHSVTGPLSLAAGADIRAGAGAAAIYVSTNLVIAGTVNPASPLTVGGEVRLLSDLYIVGLSSAARYYGDGSGLTSVDAATLDSLGSLDFVRKTGSAAETITGAKTFSGPVTVTDARGIYAGRQVLAAGVEISSAPAAQYGGVHVSTHIYISGNVYLGQNALHVGGGAANQVLKKNAAGHLEWGDDQGGVSGTGLQYRLPVWNTDTVLANSVMNQDGGGNSVTLIASTLTVGGAQGIYANRHMFARGVEMSSAAASQYGGVYVSTHIYLPAGARYYGDGSGLTGLPGDNLGSHLAAQDLKMAGFGLVNAGAITANSQITTYSSMTVAGSGFSVGGSTLVVSNGNVGIGAPSPAARFTVTGGQSPGDYIMIFNSGAKVAAWLRNKQ